MTSHMNPGFSFLADNTSQPSAVVSADHEDGTLKLSSASEEKENPKANENYGLVLVLFVRAVFNAKPNLFL